MVCLYNYYIGNFPATSDNSCTNGTVQLVHSVEPKEHVVLGYLHVCVRGHLLAVHISAGVTSNMTLVSDMACRGLGYQGVLM